MSIMKRLKLLFAIIILGIGCFGIVLYEDNAIATVGANSASISAPAYNVGSEYDGVITHQYVNTGDSVTAGQNLFELRSNRLTADLKSGTIKADNLTSKLSNDGGLLLAAQRAGVVSQISYLEGSFVGGGKTIATISGTSGVSVRANFELSGQQYAKVKPTTPVLVQLGGTSITATITSITQQSSNGHTITTINANLPTLQMRQAIYSTGTPTTAKLLLNANPLYKQLQQSAKSYIH
jgi:multidrug resistance efflux pump